MDDKTEAAFRTISEVAKHLQLPQHVLRFWETRFPQIRPIKRSGGRRYYRPEDIALLRVIRSLLYDEGMTIKGAQKILQDRGRENLYKKDDVKKTINTPVYSEPLQEAQKTVFDVGFIQPTSAPYPRDELKRLLSDLQEASRLLDRIKHR